MSNDNVLGNSFLSSLRNSVGRVITVFTESGGCTGCGFTGVLVDYDCRAVRLLTSMPDPPTNPFCRSGYASRRYNCDPLGTTTIIPVNKIVSVCFNQL